MPTDAVHAWVINLDRAPQRLARVGAALDALGLRWTRLPGVEGRTLDGASVDAALDRPGFEALHGMTPALGELGCYLSHVQALRAFLSSPHAHALILEDDVQPTVALPAVLDDLVRLQDRWDLVKLSAIHSGTPLMVQALAQGHGLAVMLSRCTGSSAYLVNRRAAQVLVDALLPMQLPYDHAFDRGWRYGLKVRRVVPEACVHDDQVVSTIGNPGQARKFPWYRRGSTYGYRLRNELQRLAYGVGQWWAEARRPKPRQEARREPR